MPQRHILFSDDLLVDDTIVRFGGPLEKKVTDKEMDVEFNDKKVGFSFKGAETRRPLNKYEKLELLKRLLKKHDALKEKRPTVKYFEGEFIYEKCRAFRVVVPENVVNPHKTPALSFWISSGFPTDGMLCLMEGNRTDSATPYYAGKCSNYTLLQSLIFFAREQSGAGVLDNFIPNEPHSNPYAKANDTHPPSLITTFHNVRGYNSDFIKDPHELLTRWGCLLGASINIETIYRIREFGPEDVTGWQSISTFAYALSIQDADR